MSGKSIKKTAFMVVGLCIKIKSFKGNSNKTTVRIFFVGVFKKWRGISTLDHLL